MKLTALLLSLLAIKTANAVGCVWDLNVDLPQQDPLYYTPAAPFNLIIPGPTGITLNLNQFMTMTCVGKTNTIFGTGQQELTLPCTANNKLLYNGMPLALSQFFCAGSTLSDVVLTGVACANGRGELMNLGFNSTKGFSTLIEVCFDRVNEANIYSINTIYSSIANAEVESDRPAFRNQGLTYGTNTANAYKQTSQKTRFTQLLGLNQANLYITTASFLSRGHVSPDADFLFGSWSTATYFLVNAAPEWQVVNAGNWLRVENLARDTTDIRQQDTKVYTGTHGVLKLPNGSGVLTEIYLLDPQKLPVPKWYWKILYSPSTTQGIAFVTLNNPHVSTISPSELLCPNVCAQTNWSKPEWSDFSKGYTYCCYVNDLVASLNSVSPFTLSGPMIGNV